MLTTAVRKAVRERLLALARDCTEALGNVGHSSEHGDLYGPDGMPARSSTPRSFSPSS